MSMTTVYKDAKDIEVGDYLKTEDGSVRRVTSVILRSWYVECRMANAKWEYFNEDTTVNVYQRERMPTYQKNDDGHYLYV